VSTVYYVTQARFLLPNVPDNASSIFAGRNALGLIFGHFNVDNLFTKMVKIIFKNGFKMIHLLQLFHLFSGRYKLQILA
jgi:hypothetical protein